MKYLLTGCVAGLLLAGTGAAQMSFPGGQKRIVPRPLAGGASGGVNLTPGSTPGPDERKVRYITHVVLAGPRQWTSSDGKTLEAKWIAFEDLVVETAKGAPQPSAPVPPANPTVVRDGKIRLASNQKVYELALERLSQADRDFVEQVRVARAKKPVPASEP